MLQSTARVSINKSYALTEPLFKVDITRNKRKNHLFTRERRLLMEEITVGTIVTGIYKTGKYIGEVTAVRPMHYLVKVKAVLKHPQQGDLHAPKEVDVPLFHERRALAFHEQTNIPKNMVKVYDGEVLDYKASLKAALESSRESLQQDSSVWAKRCLENLEILEKEYKW